MTLASPDWLTRRQATLKLGPDHKTWYLLLGDEPHYSLACVPAGGKYGCAIRQTESGRRLDHPATYESPEAAIRGGLEALGKELGWTG